MKPTLKAMLKIRHKIIRLRERDPLLNVFNEFALLGIRIGWSPVQYFTRLPLDDKNPRNMSDLDEEFQNAYDTPVYEALRAAEFGYTWSEGYATEPFNVLDDYFAINGAGNLVSISEMWINRYIQCTCDTESYFTFLLDYSVRDEDAWKWLLELAEEIGIDTDKVIRSSVKTTRG